MKNYSPTTKNGKCVFCEIVSGEIQTPGIFWQNKEFMAFLSIDPNTEGFSCIIPKKHFDSDVLKMPNNVLQRFIVASKEVAQILENNFNDVGRIGLMMEGTGINHAHIKLMPLHGTNNLKRGVWEQFLSGKKFWFDKYEGWICSGGGISADPKKLKKLARKLTQNQIKKAYK